MGPPRSGVPRERFIPWRFSDLVTLVRTRAPAGVRPAPGEEQDFVAWCALLSATIHHQFHLRLQELRDRYAPFDPDADTVPVQALPDGEADRARVAFLEGLGALLAQANYRRVERAELEAALATESVFKVRLHTRLDDFAELIIHARGERRRQEVVPRWSGFGSRLIEVEYFERVVLYVRFKDAAHLGRRRRRLPVPPGTAVLKLFRNIPRADLEMLLPNSEVRMKALDQALIGIPALIGIAGLTAKIAVLVAFAVGLAAWAASSLGLRQNAAGPPPNLGQFTAILAAGITIWLFINRQLMRYRFRKMQFMQALTQGLYFRNLDNNAGVLHHLAVEAEEEEAKEALLAYAFLRGAPDGLTAAELDARIEAWCAGLGQEVDFEVEDGLAKLERLGLLDRDGERLRVPALPEALRRLDVRWDALYQPA